MAIEPRTSRGSSDSTNDDATLALGADARAADAPGEAAPFDAIGPYRPLVELGRGGQAVVYLAEDRRLKRFVALKILKAGGGVSESMLRRFVREAEVASKLDHPGICAIYDAGIDLGSPYIAMRYVEGSTLAACIAAARALRGLPAVVPHGRALARPQHSGESSTAQTGVPLEGVIVDVVPPPLAVSTRADVMALVAIIEKVARALHAAHEAGVIHRDIKPGNILLTPRGDPVILDFGLAGDELAEGPSLTQAGELLGTPSYLSPEQLATRDIAIDRRTDVFSLGVTLFECLTLQRPFQAPTREALYRAIQIEDAANPRTLNPAIPDDLRVVIDAALEKDRDRRYQTCEAFADDLAAVVEGRPVSVKRVGAIGRVVRWSRRRPAAAALVIVLAVGLSIVAALTGSMIASRPDVERGREQARRERIEGMLEDGYGELGEGSREVALRRFDDVLALDPGSPEAIAGGALALSEVHRYEEAAARLDAHGEVAAREPALARLRSEILYTLGRPVESRPIEAGPTQPSSSFELFLLALHEIALGHDGDAGAFRRALDLATKACLRSDRARALYVFQRAHAAGHCHDRDAILDTAEMLEAHWPRSARAWAWISYAMRGVDTDRAIDAARRSLAIDATRSEVHESLGNALLDKGATREAIAAYEAALRLRPGQRTVENALAMAHDKQGDRVGALAIYDRLVAALPGDAGMRVARATVLLEAGRLDEVISEARRAVEDAPRLASASNLLGSALAQQGKFEEAIVELRRAIEENPEYAKAYTNLGIALAQSGKTGEAVTAWRKSLDLDPRVPETWTNLGVALQRQRKFDESIRAHEKAIEMQPAFLDAFHNLAATCTAAGRPDDAITAYRRALAVKPDSAETMCKLGQTLVRRGACAEGLEWLRRGHEIGSRRKDWRLPSAKWLEGAEKMAAIESRLASQDGPAASPDEERDFADLLLRKGKAAAALDRFLAAFGAKPELEESPGSADRLLAARAAALASAEGSGGGATTAPDEGARAARRAYALEWLNDEVEAIAARTGNQLTRGAARAALENLRDDPVFAPFHTGAKACVLPESERAAWARLWRDVDAKIDGLEQ